jgi:phosphoadenosine phosphosulfate reductase
VRGLSDTLARAAQHEQLVFLCSFQKEESVIVDELLRVAPHTRVVTIDTGVLFPETLATWRAFEERFGVHVEVEDASGAWIGPEHCCGEAKVAALERALDGAEAWVTGIRREQAATRADAEFVEWDDKRSMWKYNPLADWTERDVWQRIFERELPYHPLHDQGYASIGCAPCTQPGSGRDGRWAGTDKLECGLHVSDAASA